MLVMSRAVVTLLPAEELNQAVKGWLVSSVQHGQLNCFVGGCFSQEGEEELALHL